MSSEFNSKKGIDNIFKKSRDYYEVSETIRHLYMSDGSLNVLMDFERVMDEMDMYAFKNWTLGELVEGPSIEMYSVGCIFLWPEHLMPDPRAGKRLVQFGCKIKYKRSEMSVPVKVETQDDLRDHSKKPKLMKKKIWLVEIVMPKDLLSDIRTGSIELEDERIDLEDLDLAYEEDLEDSAVKNDEIDEFADEIQDQSMGDEERGMGEEF